MKTRGFTLIELVTVIMITGVLAAALTIFLKPAVDSYFAARRRADLTDMADTALRRMSQDIRRAVPNSIVTSGPLCFGLVPTTTGGRYRAGPDTANDGPTPLPCAASATCSAPLDTTQATTVFDVLSPLPVSPPTLSPLSVTPVVGDFVVIDNQNGGDVYVGTNRAAIAAVAVPARATDGLARITIAPKQFPPGYEGGRFVVVSQKEQVVYYNCVGTTLYRTVALFSDVPATACARTNGAKVATDVANVAGAPACTFVYNPGATATQQSGFVATSLTLSQDGENVTLAYGTHVDNVP